ncbi:hypothetical protein Tco_0375862 [Tanacetum coccineum]
MQIHSPSSSSYYNDSQKDVNSENTNHNFRCIGKDCDLTTAVEAQTAANRSASNPNNLTGTPTVKMGNYKEFISVTLSALNVTFATGTLTDDALSWWNAYAQPMGIEQANQITWTELKRLLTNKYCPRTEIKKIEDEFYGLTVNGITYGSLSWGGLPQSIEGNVTASKPQTLEEATNIAHRLMDQIIKRNSVQETNDHKRKIDDRRNTTNNTIPNASQQQ